MKKLLYLFFTVLFLMQISNAQKTYFQTGHTNDILEVHFSPDDSQLVSYSAGDGNFILWDVKSGQQIWTRETSFIRKAKESINLKEFYWSKDGKTLVTRSVNGTYQTWGALTGKVITLTETKPEIELITPNKKSVIYTRDYENLTVTDSESGATKIFKSYGGSSAAVDTSNNGEMIAEGGGYGDGFVKITNIKNEKTWRLGARPGIIKEVKFTPNGKFLAVAGNDKNIYVFDVQQPSLAKTLTDHQNTVEKIAFSSDSKLLISSAAFDALNIWNWQNTEILRSKKSYEWLRFASSIIPLDADVNQIITQYDSPSFEVRNTQNWEVLSEFKTKEKYTEKSGRFSYTHKSVPGSVIKISKDGKQIFANYSDGKIRVWDINSAKLLREINADSKNCRIRMLPDEKSFLSFCPSNEKERIKQISFETGKVLKSYADEDSDEDEIFFNTQFIKSIEISPNGKYFLTSEHTGDVLLWDLGKTKPIREFEIGFSGDDSIAFSPDGKTFAVGGLNQNLFLFNVETGEKLWQLIPSYQPNELEIQLEERGKKGRAEVEARKAERDKQAETEVPMLSKKITTKFSHYGDAEIFWDQKIAESGAANKSKLKLPKEKAKVAWFTLTNDSDLPVSIDTNSMMFNPKCQGLCDGAEISSRYVLELKSGETSVNGFDMFSKTILLPKRSVYFSIALEDFAKSKAIYLGFTFQKDNAGDEHLNDYGTEQKLYLRETDLPK
jgi:WD40 repeat protein